MGHLKIKHLENIEINRSNWDYTIKNSFNANIFAYAWYLDIICDDWEALITDNYEFVMPLPIKQWHGIKMVYHSQFLEKLGVFSFNKLTPSIIEQFLNSIPYTNVNLQLNIYNSLSPATKHLSKHFLPALDLIAPYKTIRKNYHPTTLDLVEKAKNNKQFSIQALNPNEFTFFINQHRKPSVTAIESLIFKRLTAYLARYKSAGFYGTYNNKNMLTATVLLVQANKRLVLLDGAENKLEQEKLPIFSLIDFIIARNSEKNLVLEFSTNTSDWGRYFTKKENSIWIYTRGIFATFSILKKIFVGNIF